MAPVDAAAGGMAVRPMVLEREPVEGSEHVAAAPRLEAALGVEPVGHGDLFGLGGLTGVAGVGLRSNQLAILIGLGTRRTLLRELAAALRKEGFAVVLCAMQVAEDQSLAGLCRHIEVTLAKSYPLPSLPKWTPVEPQSTSFCYWLGEAQQKLRQLEDELLLRRSELAVATQKAEASKRLADRKFIAPA